MQKLEVRMQKLEIQLLRAVAFKSFFTAKVAKNAQRTQRNLRISSYRLGILNSAF